MPRSSGFSLIELMIVVTVIAIIAAVALPGYDRYVTKSRRSDAQQLLMEISSKEAQYLFDARSYTATIGTGGLNIARTGWTCATNCTNQYYTVSVSAPSTAVPPTFTVTATPIAGSSQASDGNLTVDNTGAKTGTW